MTLYNVLIIIIADPTDARNALQYEGTVGCKQQGRSDWRRKALIGWHRMAVIGCFPHQITVVGCSSQPSIDC